MAKTTIRDIIDSPVPGYGIRAAFPKEALKKPAPKLEEGEEVEDGEELEQEKPEFKGPGSPLAQHVSQNLQDPLGKTKAGFEELNKKQMEYELAKQNMARNLAPVKSVIQHVEQMHDMNRNGIPDEMENDEAMGYQDPNQRQQMAGKPGMPMPAQRPVQPQPGAMTPKAPLRSPQPPAQGGQPNPQAKKVATGKKPPVGKDSGRGVQVSVKAGTANYGATGRLANQAGVAALKSGSGCKMGACSDSVPMKAKAKK